MARPSAAKAGAVIVCEGYTDVLAMHQAGVTNVVASMGTALTEDQIGELGRLAPTVQLALDADNAGQEAMLRAARVAAGRKLELRVVPLPVGRDPAEVALAEGADAVRELVGRSVPFVRFQVERTLLQGDLQSAEGKDDVIAQLRPAFAGLGPSMLQQELVALVADRLDIDAELAQRLLYQGGGAARSPGRSDRGPGPSPAPIAAATPARQLADRDARVERGFLTLCLTFPGDGAKYLGELTPDHFTDPLTARAADWLRDRLDRPLEGLPEDDELHAFLSRMLAHAGQATSKPAVLRADAIQLKRALLARRKKTAKGPEVTEIMRLDIALQAEFDEAQEAAMG
jgi:DNA primase